MIKYIIAFIFLVLFSAAFFFYYWSGGLIAHSTTDMLASANVFLEDVGAGRSDNAYARTSSRFRKEHSPEQFRALIGKQPLLKSQPTRQIDGYSVTRSWKQGKADYRAILRVAKESVPVKLTLVTEEAEWKVDDVAVEAR